MLKNPRHQEILKILEKSTYASIQDITKLTYSSISTIRRDLIYLEQKNLLVRSHGGAMLPHSSNVVPTAFRATSNVLAKKAICKKVLSQIQDSMTIFLDDSTTLSFLVKYLHNFENLNLITNSLRLSNILANENLPFACTGGKITNHTCFTGSQTEAFIRRYNADLYLFSSTGITPNGLIVDNGELETSIKNVMLENSQKHIYLCDESKIINSAKFNLTNISNVDMIYTTAPKELFSFGQEKIVFVDA